MSKVRAPAVAGMFYPAEPHVLRRAVQEYLRAAAPGPAPKALVVPHAGYEYSGPVAGSGYALLAAARERIRRVLLLGPAHRVPVLGLALPEAHALATPLGEVPVDHQAAAQLAELPQVERSDRAHALEHSLEVQLPFLQETLTAFAVVPLVVGDALVEEVEQVIDAAWGGEETLVVVSSDLSHYHDYAAARRLDQAAAEAIAQLRDEDLRRDQACGCLPVRGLLRSVRRHRLSGRTVDLRSSGDTAGPRDQVVGYGAFAFD
jgi:AmmeMemoRadiSam system protein B